MTEVCDMKDCPLYDCFMDVTKFEPFKKQLADYEAKLKEVPMKYSGNATADLTNWIEQVDIKIRTTCLACSHFRKLDMYQLFITEEAKNILLK